jgi:hypothetical protein
MSRVTSITYGRTFNNGNYETSRIDVTCDVRPDEAPEDIIEELFKVVHEMREQERR